MADPNDEIAASCETAQRSFAPAKLPKALTVGPNGTVTVPVGNAARPAGVRRHPGDGAAQGRGKKGKTIAKSSAPQATGAVKLRFKLPKLSSGSLSRRPSVRVQIGVVAIAADGRRFPLSLHSGSPGPLRGDRAARQSAAAEDPRQAAPPARALTKASAASPTAAGAATNGPEKASTTTTSASETAAAARRRPSSSRTPAAVAAT